MKFLVARSTLHHALHHVEAAIDRKPTRAALGGVCIEALNDSLVLSATDLEVAARFVISEVQVDEPGVVVVPGRQFSEVIKDFEATTVRAESKDASLAIESGEDVCSLVILPADEFPGIPEMADKASLTMPAATFLDMVQATRFATSRVREGRFATDGVLFEIEQGQATMVGTDGRRLSCIRRDADSKEAKFRVVLLPRALDQILRYGQEEADGELEIFFLESQVGFRLGEYECFGRVLEGEFPNYSNVIPGDGKHVAQFHRQSLMQKLRLASHLAEDGAAQVRFEFKSDQLEVSAESEGRGRATASLEVAYNGEGLSTLFNPAFILDGIKASHEEQIELQMDDATRPARFTLGDDYTYVVMPLQTFV